MLTACTSKGSLEVKVYETSANGNKLTQLTDFATNKNTISIKVETKQQH